MITIKQKGDFKRTYKYLNAVKEPVKISILKKYGKKGVEALRFHTPKDTGTTAGSWSYDIIQGKESVRIVFSNSNIQNGVPIAIILQYGHATNNGGWVEGIDYINPALKPIFDDIAEDAWKEVTRL